MKKIKIVFIILLTIFLMLLGTGCEEKEKKYVFVGKDTNNQYMCKIYDGFNQACTEMGVESEFVGGTIADPEVQKQVVANIIKQNVEGIAIAANDSENLNELLKTANSTGINIISLDSPLDSDVRKFHIQQADPEKIGRSLIRGAYSLLEGKGNIAILSATKEAPNQNEWIDWMKRECAEYSDKYQNMKIVAVVYGDDDASKSAVRANELLNRGNIDLIISPTTVGIAAASNVIAERGSSVKVIGLGLPSQMAQYIESGICPEMYLWNPIDIGYLAGYSLINLSDGLIEGNTEETFLAGYLGERDITLDSNQKPEVMVGEPFKFDINNIDEWKDVY